MTKLSVNVNKIALLRNQRDLDIPSVLRAAETCIGAGAHGITVHPRPDQRHIRTTDVFELAELLKDHPQIEYNIEGNPFPDFLELVHKVKPAQVTLVPDSPDQSTSDHGWDIVAEGERLTPIIRDLQAHGMRVSLFMDAEFTDWNLVHETGAQRVELYTEPYARAYAQGSASNTLTLFAQAVKGAQAMGIGVNAGHDLNLENVADFCSIPGILEVSIGHALIAEAIDLGLRETVKRYVALMA